MSIFDRNWADLEWSEWVPLSGSGADFKSLHTDTGLYRIRALEMDNSLLYIGRTVRRSNSSGCRRRISDLRRGTYKDEMPFNDPHTAAPNLWVWRQEESYTYECSVTQTIPGMDLSNDLRRFTELWEDRTLWLHRIQTGVSTLCNYGKFHTGYTKSTGSKRGIRGEKLAISGKSLSSTTPLQLNGEPADSDWMNLDWSDFQSLEAGVVSTVRNESGVYRILNSLTNEIIYIGEAKSLRNRLIQHAKKNWQGLTLQFSFALLPDYHKFQLHEIED